MQILELPSDLAWAAVILAAWVLGEFLRGKWHLPRISTYALVGFICGPTQLGLLPDISSGHVLLLANIAFGLILFEAGHRLNLRWLKHNTWLAVASLVESLVTFVAVYLVALQFDIPVTSALLLAALSMASSPATVLRVVNELRSSGQVTERALHLSVLNCMLAVFVFKLLLGYRVFETSGSALQAGYNSLLVLLLSAALGAVFGIAIPAVLRMLRRTHSDATLAFAIAVILLVALTHYLKQSPVLATLAFGVVCRHRRIMLGRAERGFGALGDVLSVLLFVSVAASINWNLAASGWLLGLALVLTRTLTKTATLWCFARPSGVSFNKGALTGIAMAPFSVFVILVLEQTRHLGINLIDQLAPLAAAALLLEIIGPLLTQMALKAARELPETEGR
jgi:Kef-type K+ transport system membrane component KefB